MYIHSTRTLAAALLAPLLIPASAADVPPRSLAAVVGGAAIDVYLRHPVGCAPRGALLVFHGQRRNAADYLTYAAGLAQRHCLLLAAPELDAERFSSRRYQRGGIVRRGLPSPRAQWASTLVAELGAWVRGQAGDPALPLWLFGHSAGGQFLSRAAAFAPVPGIARIVVANPSSHVLPSLGEAAPYGLGGVYPSAEADGALAAYLAQPLTIYLGGGDTGDDHLLDHPAARRQGANRLERGRQVYAQGKAAAARLGVAFNWTLVVAPAVGHDARAMLDAPQAPMALGLPPRHPRPDTGR